MNADAPEEDYPQGWENRTFEQSNDKVNWLADST
jgi:hypothetical protein